jgi:hypothetical protein
MGLYNEDDLIYVTKSPDYCLRDARVGSLGTRGRYVISVSYILLQVPSLLSDTVPSHASLCTRYSRLDSRAVGVESQCKISSPHHADRSQGPPSLLCNGCRSFFIEGKVNRK